MNYRELVIVRGGGDLATGTIYRLYKAGFRVLVLESAAPTAIRREAAFCEAVRLGSMEVEGVTARRVDLDSRQLEGCWDTGVIPVVIDEKASAVRLLYPQVVVDAIIAKKNIGTNRSMAPFVVALGPGFRAGRRDDPEADVDVVIETMRGHNLGRLIYEGCAAPNTGVPGLIAGEGIRRVVHASSAGIIQNISAIGDIVEEGQTIAWILPEDTASEEQQIMDYVSQDESGHGIPVHASLSGVLRGIIQDGFHVWEGMKIADIDPRREQQKNCWTISDKARALGGSVLEAIDHYLYG